MIPYFDIEIFKLGPLTIHTWGLFVATGFAVSLWVAHRRARQLGLDGHKVLDLTFWIIIFAFIGARLFHVFFYEWPYYRENFDEIIRIDQGGLSSFGGFIGAVVAFVVYTHRVIARHVVPKQSYGIATAAKGGLAMTRLKYADLLMFAWPLGHGIGRLGCFLVHMHPGRLSNAPWAVQYPGGARLDMGLIESVGLLSYWVIIYLAPRGRKMFEGFYLISGMIFYGVLRFTLDFFRAADLPMSDARYFGLTPAQYGSAVLVLAGIIFARRRLRYGKSA